VKQVIYGDCGLLRDYTPKFETGLNSSFRNDWLFTQPGENLTNGWPLAMGASLGATNCCGGFTFTLVGSVNYVTLLELLRTLKKTVFVFSTPNNGGVYTAKEVSRQFQALKTIAEERYKGLQLQCIELQEGLLYLVTVQINNQDTFKSFYSGE
jgi:hypothetical protein